MIYVRDNKCFSKGHNKNDTLKAFVKLIIHSPYYNRHAHGTTHAHGTKRTYYLSKNKWRKNVSDSVSTAVWITK